MFCKSPLEGDTATVRKLTLKPLGAVGPVVLTAPTGGGIIGGVAAGTPGQVLTVNGSGVPAWAAAGTPGSHVLASTSGLGASHTATGLTVGQVLRAISATNAAFQALIASDIPAHPLANHTVTGLTPGQVLTALSAGTFGWSSPAASLVDGAWTDYNSGTNKVDIKLRSPAVIATGGVVVEYSTIQGAINAATSGQTVSITPGVYAESITLKNGVIVTEMIPGTVTLTEGVTTADGGYLRVSKISIRDDGEIPSTSTHAIAIAHTSTTARCIIIADVIEIVVYSAAFLSCVYNELGDTGRTDIYARDLFATNTNPDPLAGAAGFYVQDGVSYLWTGSIISTTVDVYAASPAVVYLGNGINYSTSGGNGTISLLPGSSVYTGVSGAWTYWNNSTRLYDLRLKSPAVLSYQTGVVTEYATILAANAAASAYDTVVLPPGVYHEAVQLRANIPIVELIPGTVTISLINQEYDFPIRTVAGGYLSVYKIAVAQPNTPDPNDGIAVYADHGSGSCYIKANIISSSNVATTGRNNYGVYAKLTASDAILVLDVDSIVVDASAPVASGLSANVNGSVYASIRSISVSQRLAGGYASGVDCGGGSVYATVDAIVVNSTAGNSSGRVWVAQIGHWVDATANCRLSLRVRSGKATMTGAGIAFGCAIRATAYVNASDYLSVAIDEELNGTSTTGTGYGAYCEAVGAITLRGGGAVYGSSSDVVETAGALYVVGCQFNAAKVSGSPDYVDLGNISYGDIKASGDFYSGAQAGLQAQMNNMRVRSVLWSQVFG